MKGIFGLKLVLAGLIVGVIGSSRLGFAEEEVLRLDEIVVTGTKSERRLGDVPVRTEIITAKEIEERGALTLFEALEGMPGVRVENQCSFCAFSMVRMQGLGADHTQILINGMPIFSGLAAVYGLDQIPTANIERIEVVKGAGSALHGAGAVAGVINIITKKPAEEPQLEVSMSIGEHNTKNVSLFASQRTENASIVITGQKHARDEIFVEGARAQIYRCCDGCEYRISDGVRFDNISLGTKINFYLSDVDKLTVSGRVLNEARKGGAKGYIEGPFAANSEHIDTIRSETTVGYEREFAGGNSLTTKLAYVVHNRNATNKTFACTYECATGGYPSYSLLQPYLADEVLFVADLHYRHPVGRHNLLAGIKYSFNELDESGMYVYECCCPPGEVYVFKSRSEKVADDIGIYLQNEFKATDNLELVLGVRYDNHSSRTESRGKDDVIVRDTHNETSINPRFAVKYDVNPDLILRASAGTGFRVPFGFKKDAHLCGVSPRVYLPGDLDPETSVSFNVGIDKTLGAHLVGLNIFRTNLSDKIAAGAPDCAVKEKYRRQWHNVGDAHTQGMEVGVLIGGIEDFDIGLNFTYTDAQLEKKRCEWERPSGGKYYADSIYISRVPQFTGGLNLTYSPQNWKINFALNYTGRMFIDYLSFDDCCPPHGGTATSNDRGAAHAVPVNGELSDCAEIKRTDAFVVCSIKVSNEISDGIELFVGVKNMFDFIQEDKRPADAAFMYAPYTGRLVYGGMEVRF